MRSSSDPMLRAKLLLEGMWAGDLNDLISSTISIDEFESKVDDKAMVVGFYVHDLDAASDLNRFIQKSTVDILYSEVSPAPDQRGFYIVFVELINNKNLVDNICDLIDEVTFITNVSEWTANIFGTDKANVKVSKDTLTDALKIADAADKKKTARDNEQRELVLTKKVDRLKKKLKSAQRRLGESSLDGVDIVNGCLRFRSQNRTRDFVVEQIANASSLDMGAISMDFVDLRECRNLAIDLGEGWDVEKIDGSFVLHQLESDAVIVLRPSE